MKKILLSMVVLAALAVMTTKVNAQTENTAAGANIIAPITISELTALHFGSLSVSGSLGTCVLSTTGVRSRTGGVALSSFLPAATNAAYTVSGANNATFTITLPSTITVTESGTSTTMTIDNLNARVGGAGADATTGTLSVAGVATFSVGGTLKVAVDQVAALYAGIFDVTVAYN